MYGTKKDDVTGVVLSRELIQLSSASSSDVSSLS
jgi:hypothetical protein